MIVHVIVIKKEVDLTQYYGTCYYSGRETYTSSGTISYAIYKLKNGLATIHVHPFKTSSLEYSVVFYDPNDYDNFYGSFLALHTFPEYVNNEYIEIKSI